MAGPFHPPHAGPCIGFTITPHCVACNHRNHRTRHLTDSLPSCPHAVILTTMSAARGGVPYQSQSQSRGIALPTRPVPRGKAAPGRARMHGIGRIQRKARGGTGRNTPPFAERQCPAKKSRSTPRPSSPPWVAATLPPRRRCHRHVVNGNFEQLTPGTIQSDSVVLLATKISTGALFTGASVAAAALVGPCVEAEVARRETKVTPFLGASVAFSPSPHRFPPFCPNGVILPTQCPLPTRPRTHRERIQRLGTNALAWVVLPLRERRPCWHR